MTEIHRFEIQDDIRQTSSPEGVETVAVVLVRPSMCEPGQSFQEIILGSGPMGVHVEWLGNSTEASLFRCSSAGEINANVRTQDILELARRIVRYANDPLKSYAMRGERVFAKPHK